MNTLRPNLPPLPTRIKTLPVDERGFPVPWFVAWVDGKPEFRAMDHRKLVLAINKKLCWVCGQKLGSRFTFVIGPMCGINRVSSEPPSHRECAEFSAKACPFLTMPKMVRREGGIIEEAKNPGGIMITRNPGVTLLWHCRDYKVFDPGNGVLIKIGEPFEIDFYAEGRKAARAEIDRSIDTGLPLLLNACEQEETPEHRADARAQLAAQVAAFNSLLGAWA